MFKTEIKILCDKNSKYCSGCKWVDLGFNRTLKCQIFNTELQFHDVLDKECKYSTARCKECIEAEKKEVNNE